MTWTYDTLVEANDRAWQLIAALVRELESGECDPLFLLDALRRVQNALDGRREPSLEEVPE